MGTLKSNLCGLEPQLIKLEFIIYLPKLKVSRAKRPSLALRAASFATNMLEWGLLFVKRSKQRFLFEKHHQMRPAAF